MFPNLTKTVRLLLQSVENLGAARKEIVINRPCLVAFFNFAQGLLFGTVIIFHFRIKA